MDFGYGIFSYLWEMYGEILLDHMETQGMINFTVQSKMSIIPRVAGCWVDMGWIPDLEVNRQVNPSKIMGFKW